MNEALILRLFEPGWPGARTAAGRYLVDGAPDASPWCALLRADTHRVVPRDQVEPKAWDVAILWMSKLPGAWAASGDGRLSLTGPDAAEFLLDTQRLKLASVRLQAAKLLASVPVRGKVTVIVDTDRHRSALLAETKQAFDEARGDRVCAYPLEIVNGRVTGIVREPPAGQKAWWKVW